MAVLIVWLWATAAPAAEPPSDASATEPAPASAADDEAAADGAEPKAAPRPAGSEGSEAAKTAAEPAPVEPAPVEPAPTEPTPVSPPPAVNSKPAVTAPPSLRAPAAATPSGPSAEATLQASGPMSPLALTFALGGDLMHVDTDSQWGMTLRLGVQWTHPKWRLHGAAGYAYSEREARSAAFDAYLGGAYRALDWLDIGLYASAGVGSTGLFDPWYERSWAIGAEMGECLDLSDSAQLCFAQRVAPLGALTRRAEIVGGDVYRLPLETDRLIRAEATIGFRQEL